jgi:heterodisulfide reductase subunit C
MNFDNGCFSGDCGICSSCIPSTNIVVYPTPGDIYKVMTGDEFQEPPPVEKEKDTWGLYQKCLIIQMSISH